MEDSQKKGIAILGSTGSIGTQVLEVISQHKDQFSVEVLTAGKNSELLIEQALKFKPNIVVIADETQYEAISIKLAPLDIQVYCGDDAICQAVEMESIDIVLTALVGYAGLKPTLSAIDAGKNIALANKETLVVAGELVTKKAKEKGVNIYPVDSEHSAIFQCLVGEFHNPIEKLYLTASGGPFRGMKAEELKNIAKAQALNHPNWEMGEKITIDSATMMNKGLEVIEAYWLFGVKPEQIDIIVHPQSIVHSLVQFTDGSMKAQMGLPDMKLPILYAINYPNRLTTEFKRFSFIDYPSLTFEQPDLETFRNLQLAFDALDKKGNAPCVLNAANEVTVQAFLDEKISFLDIARINEETLNTVVFKKCTTLEDYMESDAEARKLAESYVEAKVI